MVFRGLAVPGHAEVETANALEVVREWASGGRFENYKATFTILDVSVIDRRWLEELREGDDLGRHCPAAWRVWRQDGGYEPLRAEGGVSATVLSSTKRGLGLRDTLARLERDTLARLEVVSMANEAGNEELDSYLGMLKSRSFGGDEMAVAPDRGELRDDFEAPAMPGADEAADWISSRLSQESVRPAFLFFVGGSGNGKSHLSAKVVKPLTGIGQHDSSADQRSYRYSTAGPDLLLVNDATIGQGTALAGDSLVSDLDGALHDGLHAVVNVNRGVLVEELLLDPEPGLGEAIVKWLAGRRHSNDDLVVVPNDRSSSRFVQTAQIVHGGKRLVDLVAVFMDKTSLMELRPESKIVDCDDKVGVGLGDYAVKRFMERTEEFTEATPSAELFRKVVGQRPPGPGALAVDPIRDNLESLDHSSVRNGLLSVFRGSEIVKASRLTYRDLWALMGQAVMGFLCESPDQDSPMAWVEENQPSRFEEQPRKQLEAMLRLAQLRTHQAIYMADCCPLVEVDSKVQSEAVGIVRSVDPVKDLLPGPPSTTEDGNPSGYGWSGPISEAFEGLEIGWSSLDALREVVDDHDDAAMVAITDFDQVLDEHVVNAQSGSYLSDSEKRGLVRWYGHYVTRLYATAHGIPAFRGQVDWWTNAWAFAESNPAGEGPYGEVVRTLLFPAHSEFREHLLLPVFDSRVVPLTGEVDEPTLVKAFRTANAVREWKVDGDSIVLYMLQGNDYSSIELDFDFAVFRELAACRSGKLGTTENTRISEPLLERFRASMLLPQTQPTPEIWVVHHDGKQLLGVPD